jgi:hypothetical protein
LNFHYWLTGTEMLSAYWRGGGGGGWWWCVWTFSLEIHQTRVSSFKFTLLSKNLNMWTHTLHGSVVRNVCSNMDIFYIQYVARKFVSSTYCLNLQSLTWWQEHPNILCEWFNNMQKPLKEISLHMAKNKNQGAPHAFQPPITSSPLGPNTLLRCLFPSTLSLP